MSARTDRIAKLTALISSDDAASHPNQAAKFTALCAKFSAMSDYEYDALMELNRRSLETGRGPAGLPIRKGA